MEQKKPIDSSLPIARAFKNLNQKAGDEKVSKEEFNKEIERVRAEMLRTMSYRDFLKYRSKLKRRIE